MKFFTGSFAERLQHIDRPRFTMSSNGGKASMNAL
jgi:hypothetical protein